MVTVLAYAGKKGIFHRYLCACECGKQFETYRNSLIGRVKFLKSCGCDRREVIASIKLRSTTHGLSSSPIYRRWRSMMDRCYNPSNKKYPRYGGRGIKVCTRWHNFKLFFSDIGHPPKPELSLDRIQTDGDYEQNNVRWASQKTQQNNRNNNRVLIINGTSRTVNEWSVISGISPKVIRQRIDRDGLSGSDAIKPIKMKTSNKKGNE